MCNNILQYGHAYAWAREHERKSVSMRFCYKYQYFHICSTRYHNFFTYLFAKYMAKWGLMPVVSFHHTDEDTTDKERRLEAAGNVLLEGWYVRFYDLFLKYKREILDLFAFKKNILDKTRSYLGATTATGDLNLGVHIRRGDYKTWKGGRYYFDDATYIGYIRRFAEAHPGRNINVFICGNDPDLDHAVYTDALPATHLFFPAGNPAEDLCLLSECDYIMGAPSTFSLVAAMYHDRPLMWIYDKTPAADAIVFRDFDTLFRRIE